MKPIAIRHVAFEDPGLLGPIMSERLRTGGQGFENPLGANRVPARVFARLMFFAGP